MHDVVCRAGPSDRPFEEQHEGFSVSAVVEGIFTYRSDAGDRLLYPGASLLGTMAGVLNAVMRTGAAIAASP